MAYDVFISYRRQGGGADARMMYDRLANAGYTVSFDMDTLKNGNFNEELLKRVAECKNFVVLLSEGCFDRTLEGCKRENDWLRIEIATALYNNKNIVTVMLPGFSFPEMLPPDIDAIRFKNGPKYDLEYIDAFYDRLKKDFLVKEDVSFAESISKLETEYENAPSEEEDQQDILDVIGDDTDFLRTEALARYGAISRLLPYTELNALDQRWEEAERAKSRGDFRTAGSAYLDVMDRCEHATPCSSAFVMRMAGDGIDTHSRDWFDKALAKAQDQFSKDYVDYEYGVGSIYAQGLGVSQDSAAAFRWFERAARHGHLQAMAAVGTAYSIGDGVEPDYAAAVRWLRESADAGIPLAEERMGFLYLNGFGVDQDATVAKEWFEKAAASGNSSARAALGEIYGNGVGVEADIEKALSWYRQAAADDNAVALRALAENLFADDSKETDYHEALDCCRRAVDKGDLESICLLGKAYETGLGVPVDLKKAGELYANAKNLGSAAAERCLKEMEPQTQYDLGVDYMEGRGVVQDFACARKWFGKAANQGHVNAQAWYGYLLATGLGGDVDMKEAIDWYEKSAKENSAVAVCNLGDMFRGGTIYKKDKVKAKEMYERAIKLWPETPAECRWIVLGAFNDLAGMYLRGIGCVRNPLLAARLYRFTAQSGSPIGCRELGILYRDGVGVAKSTEEMNYWFSKLWDTAKGVNPCDADEIGALGDATREGQGTARDLERAAEFWRRAIAVGGEPATLLNVGNQHPEIVHAGDVDLALESYRRKAEGGSALAMANLGISYRFGYFGAAKDAAKAASWFLKSAEAGFGGAMRCLCDIYGRGDGVERDDEKSLDWLIKAAENDDKKSQYWLALRYQGGTRLGRDYVKVHELIHKYLAENSSDTDALGTLALLYRDGLGVEENLEESQKIYEARIGTLSRLASDRDVDKQDDLANCYYRGWGVPIDINRAIELYKTAAAGKSACSMARLNLVFRYSVGPIHDQSLADEWARAFIDRQTCKGGAADRGDPDACELVGDYYRQGYGVDADPAVAFGWFEKAAAKKSWAAMIKMSRMLFDGDEIACDKRLAGEWAKKAIEALTPLAENGQAAAQCALADCYAQGLGIEKSVKMAIKYYGEAYEGRDWLAAGRLARFYASGEGVTQDVAKAVELLQKAIVRNDGEAEGCLGEYYEKAMCGLPQDVKKAFELYCMSASEGDACGLYNVGRCYEKGIGVEKDHEEALVWLRLAAADKGDYWGYNKKAAEFMKELAV